jgi:hypothetical protein
MLGVKTLASEFTRYLARMTPAHWIICQSWAWISTPTPRPLSSTFLDLICIVWPPFSMNLTQHDDDQKDICTKGEVYNILVPNSQGNEFVGLLAWLSFLQKPLAPQHQMCNSSNRNLHLVLFGSITGQTHSCPSSMWFMHWPPWSYIPL